MSLDKVTVHGLADNAVTSDKIGVDVIAAEDIAANAISVAEIQDGAVTHAKLHTDMDLTSKTVTLSNLDVNGQGDISGSLTMGNYITIPNNSYYGAKDTSNNIKRIFHLGGDNNIYINQNDMANEVRITTNNTQRLFVKSDGNVGIGASSPASKLEVNSDSSIYGITQTSTTTASGINLRNSDNNNGFINYDSSGDDSLRGFVDNGAGNGTFKVFQFEAEEVYTRGPLTKSEFGNLASPYTTSGEGRDYKNVFLKHTDDNQDMWIYRDYTGGTANWGIYHRQLNSDLTSSTDPRVPANSINFLGDTSVGFNIDLNGGHIKSKGSYLNCFQGAAYDRGWNNAPSITVFQGASSGSGVQNTGSNGFRIHGASGNWYDFNTNGAPAGGYGDFSINLVIDGSYTTSDERKKTNISDLTDALTTLNQLRPRTFALTTSNLEIQEGFENCYGYVAQEVNTVFPHAVMHAAGREGIHENGWTDAYSVDYGKINVLAVRAIQQLSEKIDALTARIEALEN